MQLTSSEIREHLRLVWPKIQFIWLQDKTYVALPVAEVEALALGSGISKLRFNGELMDCDDYALLLNAYIKRHRIDNSETLAAEDSYHLAFGEAFGDSIRGGDFPHTLNVCITTDGIYLIEPQTYEIWKPTKNDSVLIVKM